MKLIFIFVCLLFPPALYCQSTGNSAASNAVIPSAVQQPAIAANSHYRLLQANPGNATAWFDYYKWLSSTSTVNSVEKKEQLSQTIQSSRQYIAASWQFSLMNFIASGKRNQFFLEEAILRSDNKALVYPYAIQFAIITQNQGRLKEYTYALNQLMPLSPALYEYHYNALMSAGDNAVIYAKGLSDLAPMAIVQQVYGIRKDISFRYYGQKIIPGGHDYICLSAGKEIIGAYPQADYTGLLIQLPGSTTKAALQQRVALFKLQQLKSLQKLEEDEQQLYKNYLPSFILLYRLYKESDPGLAAEWKLLSQKIGQLTESVEAVHKMLSE